MPLSAVVTKPPMLGLAIFQSENVMGRSARTSISKPMRSAVTVKVNALDTPCMVRVPCAVYCFVMPVVGRDPRGIGAVRTKVAVGYWLTSMIRPSNWALRWLWSLTTLAMSTVNEPLTRTWRRW